MFGIVIEYDYAGDEAEWQDAIDTFTGQIDADDRLRGRFSYQVNVSNDGNGRIHIGHWDEEETLKHLQSQPYFGEFAEKVKKFSGGGPKSTGFKKLGGTESTVA
ncbi:MAG: hypothetical protein HN731_01885 [Rhodospirillaceae bacterium]|jgi:quinol monooxygenase YgiN|nr:hypothetical protein [Rhodospirillaceae bacterium]MBT4735433.1 hypothetical protein [Candidatus Neomarinimicrobiota bacterium]MBT7953913.1 hypothetical protein [Rhodospirillaceae bacterium]